MPKPDRSNGGSSDNADSNNSNANDDAGNRGDGNGGNNSRRREGSSHGGRDDDDHGGSDSLRAEFRELLGTVASLKPGEREERLLRENFKVRDRLRSAQRAVEDAKKSTIPQGAIVLTGEDATAFAEFRKLNIPLKDLPSKITEGAKAISDRVQRDADTLNRKVASDLGINAHAFATLLKSNDLVLSFKEVRTKDEENPGKFLMEKVPMIRPRGEPEDKAKPLTEAMESDFTEDDLALLGAESASDDTGDMAVGSRDERSSNRHQQAADEGVRFPASRGAPPSNTAQRRKADEKAVESKQQTGRYSL